MRTANTVIAGPFSGMKYGEVQKWGSVTPILLGTYEQETAFVFDRWDGNPPNLIVNVGCAEGYYAVGCALRYPRARVVAFDIDAAEQELCRETARRNGVVGRVFVTGECTPSRLEAVFRTTLRSVLIMDCEGGEEVLLDPLLTPSLRSVEILVELHEFRVLGIGSLIDDRFAGTHQITIVDAVDDREVPDLIGDLPPRQRRFAVDEHRPRSPRPMSWAHLVPRSSIDDHP